MDTLISLELSFDHDGNNRYSCNIAAIKNLSILLEIEAINTYVFDFHSLISLHIDIIASTKVGVSRLFAEIQKMVYALRNAFNFERNG